MTGVFAGFYLLYAIVALVICVVWIVLPFILVAKLNRLRDEARAQTALLDEIARNTRPATAGKTIESSVHYRVPGLNE